jgi:hypothetical protein
VFTETTAVTDTEVALEASPSVIPTPLPASIPARSQINFALDWWETQLVLITPEYGRYIIENHDGPNRNMSKVRIDQYARDQKRGEFALSVDCITFDERSRLASGKHRILASIQSGMPFLARVVVNQPTPVLRTLDTGRTRSYSDNLAIEGNKNSALLGAVVNSLAFINDDGATSMGKYSNSERMEIHLRYKESIDTIIELVTKNAKVGGLAVAPILSAFVFAHHYTNKALVEEFAKRYATGEGLVDGMPEHTLRNHILDNKGGLSSNTDRVKATLHTLGAIKVKIQGKPMKKVHPIQNLAYNKGEVVSYFTAVPASTPTEQFALESGAA